MADIIPPQEKRHLLLVTLVTFFVVLLLSAPREVKADGDLIVDGTTETLSGSHSFENVEVINGGEIEVDSDSLVLEISNSLYVDEDSSIHANGLSSGPGDGEPYDGGDWIAGGGGAGYGGDGGRGDGWNGNGAHGGEEYGTEEDGGSNSGSRGSDAKRGGSGGLGGGRITITADTINIEGSVESNGVKGSSGRAGAGGGSGGGITLEAKEVNISGFVEADGGDGRAGSETSNSYGGGGGGGGRITIRYVFRDITGSLSAEGGDGGESNCGWWSCFGRGRHGEDGTVYFEEIEYKLTLDVEPDGSGGLEVEGENVNVPYENEYKHNTEVNILAESYQGWKFVGWTGDVGNVDDPSSADTTVTMEDDYSVTAEFEKEEHDLTVDSTDGGEVVDPGEGTFTYEHGEVIDLVAESEGGYNFIGWTGDVGNVGDPSSADTTVTMEDDYSVTAEFEKEEHDLTVDSTDGGEVVDPGEGTFTYEHGEVVGLEAVEDSDYNFVKWSGDTENVADVNSADTEIIMEDNYFVTGVFVELCEYEIYVRGEKNTWDETTVLVECSKFKSTGFEPTAITEDWFLNPIYMAGTLYENLSKILL